MAFVCLDQVDVVLYHFVDFNTQLLVNLSANNLSVDDQRQDKSDCHQHHDQKDCLPNTFLTTDIDSVLVFDEGIARFGRAVQ